MSVIYSHIVITGENSTGAGPIIAFLITQFHKEGPQRDRSTIDRQMHIRYSKYIFISTCSIQYNFT